MSSDLRSCTGEPETSDNRRGPPPGWFCRKPGRVTCNCPGAQPMLDIAHLPELSVTVEEPAVPLGVTLTCARAIGSPVTELTTVPSAEQSKLAGGAGGWPCLKTAPCPKARIAVIRMSGIDFTSTD